MLGGRTSILLLNKYHKIFLSTDDQDFEEKLKEEFGDILITSNKKFSYTKINKSKGWHYNFTRSKDHCKEAILDMYLLSKTSIQVFDSRSTFAHLAIILI